MLAFQYSPSCSLNRRPAVACGTKLPGPRARLRRSRYPSERPTQVVSAKKEDQKEERFSFLRPWLPAYLRDQPFEYQMVYYQAFATMVICAVIAVWSMAVVVLRSHQGDDERRWRRQAEISREVNDDANLRTSLQELMFEYKLRSSAVQGYTVLLLIILIIIGGFFSFMARDKSDAELTTLASIATSFFSVVFMQVMDLKQTNERMIHAQQQQQQQQQQQ